MLQQQDQSDQEQQQQQLLPQQQQQQEDELQALLEPCALIPDSHLLLVASGCVEAVELWGNRGGVVCRYAMVVGSDWQQTWGLGSGLSQESRSSYSSSKVALNFPFHAAFKVRSSKIEQQQQEQQQQQINPKKTFKCSPEGPLQCTYTRNGAPQAASELEQQNN
ncbi:hypothetical protein, conserved [Eimeria tenella]|uniref:Uncharacterized protein n=1 Tax=Eimeria tenella TaxID=5802 RepID=U6L3E6_EIMTE|nr:hypothetical protein, conserved [Eimeria tenella]CDJ43723.1 hypothetical protein, conserved [Eimeria tenella]|eukprot:XP_013234472.1 hypothetical protein, conserved [Eimeria tenella]